MKRYEYQHGHTGAKYGIYNRSAKCFQFDICEDTPMLADARLFQLIGDDACKYRFEPRRLPNDDAKIVAINCTEREASMLYDLLSVATADLSAVNAKHKISEEPLLTQAEHERLLEGMQFCGKLLLKLAQYAMG